MVVLSQWFFCLAKTKHVLWKRVVFNPRFVVRVIRMHAERYSDPLGLLWLAGTLKGSCKKLTKKRIMSSRIAELMYVIHILVNVRQSLHFHHLRRNYMDKKERALMTLRVSGTLLLGVVVIYQKKAQYLIGSLFFERVVEV